MTMPQSSCPRLRVSCCGSSPPPQASPSSTRRSQLNFPPLVVQSHDHCLRRTLRRIEQRREQCLRSESLPLIANGAHRPGRRQDGLDASDFRELHLDQVVLVPQPRRFMSHLVLFALVSQWRFFPLPSSFRWSATRKSRSMTASDSSGFAPESLRQGQLIRAIGPSPARQQIQTQYHQSDNSRHRVPAFASPPPPLDHRMLRDSPAYPPLASCCRPYRKAPARAIDVARRSRAPMPLPSSRTATPSARCPAARAPWPPPLRDHPATPWQSQIQYPPRPRSRRRATTPFPAPPTRPLRPAGAVDAPSPCR